MLLYSPTGTKGLDVYQGNNKAGSATRCQSKDEYSKATCEEQSGKM